VAQRDTFSTPKKGLALRIEAKGTELMIVGIAQPPIPKFSRVFATPSRLPGLQEHLALNTPSWSRSVLAQGHGAGASVSWQPANLAHWVAQTQPIVLVGGTGRIPLRLGMGHVADGSHKPVVIPALGETMCIRLVRLLRKCAE
jgi:hypothetical protein